MSNAISNLIGQSAAFKHALSMIERIARYDAPVLIQGETGTGKELAARAIHGLSKRRDAPFVPLNCGAVPETLFESELFGCEPGAYTDARNGRKGLVAAAEGGTLFLDELDSLSPRAQVAILRFLQDQTYRPLGGTRERLANARIVAAASPRMPGLIENGDFRADLAFRIDVLSLHIPPLRERPGDPLLLAEYFIRSYASLYGHAARPVDPTCLDWLESHCWPGNVRELDNLVHRASLLTDAAKIWLGPTPSLRPPASHGIKTASATATAGYRESREQILHAWERQYLQELMLATGGNVTRAAAMAGKERRALGKLLKRHGLSRVVSDPLGSHQAHPARTPFHPAPT
ncbi:MAG TPA: sigma 54-interacting transcriptional regulator [Parasulfuritortus sp.]